MMRLQKFFTVARARVAVLVISGVSVVTLAGCPPVPATVAFVDLERYAGLWYQVAGYEFFPTRDLVGITAEYNLLEDGRVQVINRGFVGDFDGEEDVIEGFAEVQDPVSNAKLSVSFPSVFFGLFEGEYWIIDLDDENYSYAVVSDSRRSTLFVLSRTPTLDETLLNAIIDDLVLRGYDEERILLFPQMAM